MRPPIELAKEQLDLLDQAMKSTAPPDEDFLALHATLVESYLREAIEESLRRIPFQLRAS